MKKTKIVATMGPACASPEMVEEFINHGVNVFRLNFSHGTHEEHQKYIDVVKDVRHRRRTFTAILADLQGPKIRTGEVEKNLVVGEEVVLSCYDDFTPDEIPVQYTKLYEDVRPGGTLLIDDGKIEFRVLKISGKRIHCQVIIGGLLKSHKGINLPNGSINAPSMAAKDFDDLLFALKNEVDFVALSFVRSAADIEELRRAMQDSEFMPAHIIAKIERHEALDELDEIIQSADGIMVARGDLGVETPAQEVPIIQKMIIHKAIGYGKPTIVATQMLESMIGNPRATRAETSDVANAILDGADAVMLSGETSVGAYPLEAVRVMEDIAVSTEDWISREHIRITRRIDRVLSAPEAVAQAADSISRELEAKYIVAATATGSNARALAKYRPEAEIIAVTANHSTAGTLSLSWGVTPLIMDYDSNGELARKIAVYLADKNLVSSGEHVILVSGVTKGKIGGTNLIQTIEIP